MEQERDTQIIFFKDLFFCIIRKWKPIILVALIGALLLGGTQIMQNKKTTAAQNVPLTGEELSQREQVRQAIREDRLLDFRKEFYEKYDLTKNF